MSASVQPSGRQRPKHSTLNTQHSTLNTQHPTLNTKRSTLSGAISFLNDIEPILTRAGCNAGACHGQQFGKGGFKLSLAGYDPDLDYENIVKCQNGRRASSSDPTNSLLLKKPALILPHQGGLRIARDSEDFRTIVRWLQQGAPGPNPKDPQVIGITVIPVRAVLTPKQSVKLRVKVIYSNRTVRDVTSHTRINALNDNIASATPEGFVTATGTGATAIMLRYQGLATVMYVDVPYRSVEYSVLSVERTTRQYRSILNAQHLTLNTEHSKLDTSSGYIDRLIQRRWSDLGLAPSRVCTDNEFIRRVSLDLIGTLPAPDEVRSFVANKGPAKRAVLIDNLLDRPEYCDYWTLKWSDLLRSTKAGLGAKSQAALNAWIHASFAENKPYDLFVRELITANGRANTVGPANYYRVATTPQDLTETTAQLFLGVRLQCAKCHHHPFEKWSQRDYYQFAAFFGRVGLKNSSAPDSEPVVRVLPAGEVTHPKTGERMSPTPLAFGLDERPRTTTSTSTNGVNPLTLSQEGDRRELLATWLTGPENHAFARMIVNRYWGHLMGRGIIEPVDDVRVTNPPSNPALLDALAKDFIRSGFDLKHLLRTICRSKTYQLSSSPTPANRQDVVLYSHHLPKRQPAEVLLDSICIATGSSEKFAGLPIGFRSIQLPDSGIASMFLDTFGRPARSSACECERNAEPSLTQALQMLNGDAVNRKVIDPNGRVAQLIDSGRSERELVEELYLSALSRLPTVAELKTASSTFAIRPKLQAAEDLLWALLNTKEFSYIR